MAKPIQSLPGEIWKPVLGWDGLYSISNMGRVRSEARRVFGGNKWGTRNWRSVPACLMSPGRTPYLMVVCQHEGSKSTVYIHSEVLEVFVGPRPDGYVARHLNGDINDNRLTNLAWGTYRDNELDKDRHGNVMWGTACHLAKLTPTKVRAMRALRKRTGLSYAKIGARFGVSGVTAQKAVTGRGWRRVV